MEDKRKELNGLINRMYRQLGKDLFDDLNKERLNVDQYKKAAKKIDHVISAYYSLGDVQESSDDDDMKVVAPPEKDDEGLYQFLFCQSCHAGNNPEATHCLRCNEPLR